MDISEESIESAAETTEKEIIEDKGGGKLILGGCFADRQGAGMSCQIHPIQRRKKSNLLYRAKLMSRAFHPSSITTRRMPSQSLIPAVTKTPRPSHLPPKNIFHKKQLRTLFPLTFLSSFMMMCRRKPLAKVDLKFQLTTRTYTANY